MNRPNPWSLWLRRLRDEHDLTQRTAAMVVDVSERTWANWESGPHGPGPSALHLILIAFPDALEK